MKKKITKKNEVSLSFSSKRMNLFWKYSIQNNLSLNFSFYNEYKKDFGFKNTSFQFSLYK
jgi:hypothetical protein